MLQFTAAGNIKRAHGGQTAGEHSVSDVDVLYSFLKALMCNGDVMDCRFKGQVSWTFACYVEIEKGFEFQNVALTSHSLRSMYGN